MNEKAREDQYPAICGGKPLCKSKKAYRKLLQDQVEALSDLQRLLHASLRVIRIPGDACPGATARPARRAPEAC